MPKKKAKDVVITPQHGPKAKSKSAPTPKPTRRTRGPADPTWNTSDLDFDSKGRLVILNPSLAKAILQRARDDQGIILVQGPRVPPPPPPPPVDGMCLCAVMRLDLGSDVEIKEREAPVFDSVVEGIG